ncbi:transposase [Pullulanibacillus camelliae]|uniref:Transposase n=1 Tax=Pullulanibacillus camelliae TaxID=1707096 RepID=A0A8J3E1B0_9BACL|nr:helix-turn-helix domain-containing protein [Pullulanibacillus camelliae]GGE57282.1 transposase [Pullulanibacillus camelliae]
MSKRGYTVEFKYNVINAYKNRDCSIKDFCLKFKIGKRSLMKWLDLYENYGVDGLKASKTWKQYSKVLKEAAVRDYLSGKHSKYEIVKMYQISSDSVLQKWINKYNSHRELKDTSKGRTSSMTKGRKTTWEERLDIIKYCLRNKKDYQKTAEIYEVSYQQVYSWVKKYEERGEDALKDKRGRKKEEAELTPEDKTRLEIKKLEMENERLRAENLFLKKLEEIERRRK